MSIVTVSHFLTDRENPQFRDSGILPLVLIFSVTLFSRFLKNWRIKQNV